MMKYVVLALALGSAVASMQTSKLRVGAKKEVSAESKALLKKLANEKSEYILSQTEAKKDAIKAKVVEHFNKEGSLPAVADGRSLSTLPSSTGHLYYQTMSQDCSADAPTMAYANVFEGLWTTGCDSFDASSTSVSFYTYCDSNAGVSGQNMYDTADGCSGTPADEARDNSATFDDCTSGVENKCDSGSKHFGVGVDMYASTSSAECDKSLKFAALGYNTKCFNWQESGNTYSAMLDCLDGDDAFFFTGGASSLDGIYIALFQGADCDWASYWEVQNVFNGTNSECENESLNGTLGLYFNNKVTCSGSMFQPSDDDDDVCFAGDSMLELESGLSKPLSEIAVGDRVLTSDASGELSYSDVVFMPHGPNANEAIMVELATETGKSVKATQKHLMKTCSGDLVAAGSLEVGACLVTKDGNEDISSKKLSTATGLYSAVTNNEFLVVDGVVASPFAISHAVPHAYYHIHRALYAMVPSVMKNPYVAAANALMGSFAVNLYNTAKKV